MINAFRDQGAVGALLDEYERAILELQQVISNISGEALTTIVDPETDDPDCKSIQTILSHVVRAGYGYVIEIRNSLGAEIDLVERQELPSVEDYHKALDDMFRYNLQFFEDYPNLKLEAFNPEEKFKVKWGQYYDVEQLFEHAIVHILRHRRQIERFLLRIKAVE